MAKEEILLGNGAMALGLLEGGCQVITAYPGTPSSEILPETVRLAKSESLEIYSEWSTNEKVALDNAFASAIAGKRAACCMKQVGLNVAADSLMSSAYLGTIGGLVIISADDPGPHSSQTEQDSRFMGRLAKIPVLDPSNPQEAREMAKLAFEISEEFSVPVLLRPCIRICHGRQNLSFDTIESYTKKASFKKDPSRWAATPVFRLKLHGELNKKIGKISEKFSGLSDHNFHNLEEGKTYPLGIIAGGVPYAVVRDILVEEERSDIPVLKIGTPFPFPESLSMEFMSACDRVLVLEETDTLLEYLLRDRSKVLGRLTGHVPSEGELIPGVIHKTISNLLKESDLEPLGTDDNRAVKLVKTLKLPIRKPTLCPGCPHRSAFFAIRKASPKAIFTSDIGCYTLGTNLGVVDTCLDMGAAITMASGFYHAFDQDNQKKPIIATIGDSTFYHSGSAGLMNAVYNDSRFILVILDNLTTAMTGMQPTPGLGIRADGSQGKTITLERIVAGCGIDFIKVVDPYDLEETKEALDQAKDYIYRPEAGIAVIISRHPCLIAYRGEAIPEKKKVIITDECDECNFCIERFECPALYHDETSGHTEINQQICSECGLCIQVCPKGAITEVREE